ncbi:hypothetical protein [Candidatus Aciduliprofundum boonei]|uniref:Uncharacterized protein n=1 Tax=Aciduliprofundum boonei (strain DSM 19572 / T469) TaxID=439481 RepID=B5ICE5_ACIB4|nr:hypothetical protein [Candidatus Aciduliprofundum boonei]ADD09022.1 conserved hypothetical protein [Aciduliprofundum boonei T469]EDY34207.1 hypothetical protein ABOONEI_1 [Aciduliprofundum boonei T469]EDY34890.1 hypothetical protein ABOONEI_1156 [Aciduliprofundum boonei T469]EDY36053.1 hypothetical protein ABOONEI_3014 [Aciduliprofundum boonei T469]HII55289.1 hypothetical protein [Candidatus Aciduliprofundum boonei]
MATNGTVEILERLEGEIQDIKKMLERLETMLIGEEEISEEERKELEERIKEAKNGDTVSLEEFLRDLNVQS